VRQVAQSWREKRTKKSDQREGGESRKRVRGEEEEEKGGIISVTYLSTEQC